jgi:ATP-dependent Clp protease adaptor protein ClpS
MSNRWTEEQGGVATEHETKHSVDTPRMYKVLLHNDNYTTRDFVVLVLVSIFRKPEPEAVRIMLDVHYKGIGVVGVYPRDIAETRVQAVIDLARREQFPLMCTLEAE